MRDVQPDLIADITLYTAEQGRRRSPTATGWFGCICKLAANDQHGWDCRILLHGTGIRPGETRRVGMIMLGGAEASAVLNEAGRFLLWDGCIIGEAAVIGRAHAKEEGSPSAVAVARASVTGHDFNALERRAAAFMDAGRPRDALAIYLFMGDGDPSLDAGHLAERVGRCCELLGDLHGAKWWYGRAVEENPEIPAYVEARRRLDSVTIDALLVP
jgi:hypothetical protein